MPCREPYLLFVEAKIPEPLIAIIAAIEPIKRLQTIRTANAAKLYLLLKRPLGSVELLRSEESRLRKLFEQDHVRGDWYKYSDRLLQEGGGPQAKLEAQKLLSLDELLQCPETEAIAIPTAPIPKLVTIQELAHLWKVSPRTIQRRVHDGSLKYVKIGAQIRFDLNEVKI